MDIESFRAKFSGDILTPSSGEAYSQAISRWGDNASRKAAYVTFPRTPEDVALAIKFADSHRPPMDLAVKGGGHSTSGSSSSEGGLVIDLGRYMNTAQVDEQQRKIVVGGGALWKTVDEEAIKFGMAAVAGTVNHTGVGGLSLGGGYGWLTPKHGMVVDNILEATVVVADGRILPANEAENPDLFWAIRGGGGNFGVVTSFSYRLHPQRRTVMAGILHFTPDKKETLLPAINDWFSKAGENEVGVLIFCASANTPTHGLLFVMHFNGPEEEGRKAFKGILDIEHTPMMFKTDLPYEALNGILNEITVHGDRKYMRGCTHTAPLGLDTVTDVFDRLTKDVTDNPDFERSIVLAEFFPTRKVCSVAESSTAFTNRGNYLNMNAVYWWKSPSNDAVARNYARSMALIIAQSDARAQGKQTPVEPQTRFYANYTSDIKDKPAELFGANYERLRRTKGKYDPNLRFNKWFPIQPLV